MGEGGAMKPADLACAAQPGEYNFRVDSLKSIQSGQDWSCWVCENDIGTETRALTQIVMGPRIVDHDVEGGHDIWVCAFCLSRGKVTRAT